MWVHSLRYTLPNLKNATPTDLMIPLAGTIFKYLATQRSDVFIIEPHIQSMYPHASGKSVDVRHRGVLHLVQFAFEFYVISKIKIFWFEHVRSIEYFSKLLRYLFTLNHGHLPHFNRLLSVRLWQNKPKIQRMQTHGQAKIQLVYMVYDHCSLTRAICR